MKHHNINYFFSYEIINIILQAPFPLITLQQKLLFLLLLIFFYPSIILCISQGNAQGPTSLKWHRNIKINTILEWKIKELTLLNVPHVKIGEIKHNRFDVVQIGFVQDPPSNAREFFGLDFLIYNYKPPIWMNLFVESI